MHETVQRLAKGLIVSCQASEGSALHGPAFMGAMALEAERGGACGLRINGPDDISAVRGMTSLPIIGIYKQKHVGYESYITVTFESAHQIVNAGADLVAMDGTGRPLPDGYSLSELIARIHDELHVPVMADVSTLQEGIAAAQAGADIVATTMSGYTAQSRSAINDTPDFMLIEELVATVTVPVIVEGRVTTLEQLTRCFSLGAFAVCIGGAITNPQMLTQRFVNSIHPG